MAEKTAHIRARPKAVDYQPLTLLQREKRHNPLVLN
jgi:hypothetical protein